MFRRAATIVFGYLAFACTTFANELSFSDASGYRNFTVYQVLSNGNQTELNRRESTFWLDLSSFYENQIVELRILFKVPKVEDYPNFNVRRAVNMQVAVEVKVTQELGGGFDIPVFFFDCIGACGFNQIDGQSLSILENAFSQYFKAALMAEHYKLRLRGRDNPESRRAMKLWLDSSYFLGSRKVKWWRITKDIEEASSETFDNDPNKHQATLTYIQEVNGS